MFINSPTGAVEVLEAERNAFEVTHEIVNTSNSCGFMTMTNLHKIRANGVPIHLLER